MAKKNTTPPASEAGAEGATGMDGAAGATATTPLTEEEQIRKLADERLEQASGDQAVKLSQAVARVNALEGELEREKATRKELEKQVVELTSQLAAATTAAKNAGTVIQGLPANARQLNECVTVAVLGRGGTTPRRAQVKVSDVLLATKDDDELDALQKQLGLQATVYKVSPKTLEELDVEGFLHK